MSWNGGGWGSWHVGSGVACPQGCGTHTLDEAVAANMRHSEYKRAVQWARHKEWVGHELKQTQLTESSEEVANARAKEGARRPATKEARH